MIVSKIGIKECISEKDLSGLDEMRDTELIKGEKHNRNKEVTVFRFDSYLAYVVH